MSRLVLACVLLLAPCPALAAEHPRPPKEGATEKPYEHALLLLRKAPDDPTALVGLSPVTGPRTPEERAAFERLVAFLGQAAQDDPKSFGVAYNHYTALWTSYLHFGRPADARAAFAELERGIPLAGTDPETRARCHFELARNILALPKDHASEIFPKGPRDAAIEHFIQAKRAAMSRGYFAARAALALGDLYIEKADADQARKSLREALELDTERGYVTNHAYDLLGLVLLARGNVNGAEVMLEAAGRVRPDDDIRALGHGHRLAWALIESGRYEKPLAYLENVFALAEKGGRIDAELVYELAVGHTRAGHTSRALWCWDKYLGLKDPDERRRKKAEAMARELAASVPKPDIP